MSTSSRILRPFRSHKNLKSAAPSQRERRPSECSTMSRASCESSSTTSTSASSVEWDPLRLHPPMMAPWPRSEHLDERRHTHEHNSRGRSATHPQTGIRANRSVHNMKARQAFVCQAPGTSSLEIYGGFDFGFQPNDDKDATPKPISSPEAYDSATDLSIAGSSPTDSEWGDGVSPVTPRPHPPGLAEADYFTKGDWKRRGIVFSSAEPTEAKEEECFDFERLHI